VNHSVLYTYRLAGRRVMTLFALLVGAAMLGTAAHYGAPWYFFAPVGIAVAMLIWLVVRNPQSGCDLNARSLFFFYQGKTETIPLADVASMKVTNWTDGPDTVALHLKSGKVVRVPSLCADSKLVPALRELGVID
jgi:hypothetical protein